MQNPYQCLYSLPSVLWAEGAPVTVSSGVLLRSGATGQLMAQLGFQNISPYPIQEATVQLFCRDAAGRVVCPPVVFRYQNLMVPQYGSFGQDRLIFMPHPFIQHFEVRVTEVIAGNRPIWANSQVMWHPLAAPQPVPQPVPQQEIPVQNESDPEPLTVVLPQDQPEPTPQPEPLPQKELDPTPDPEPLPQRELDPAPVTEVLPQNEFQPVPQPEPVIPAIPESAPEDGGKKAKKAKKVKEKKKKSKVGGIVTAIVLLGLALVIGILAFLYVDSYQEAIRYSEKGLFREAEMSLNFSFVTEIHDPEFLTYIEGGKLLESGEHARARQILQPLADSGYRRAKIMIQEADYQLATGYMNAMDYDAAIELFESLAASGYLDSAEKVNYCLYHKAKGLQERGKYQEAIKLFEKLRDENYADSRSQLQKTQLLYAQSCIEGGNKYDTVKKGFDMVKALKKEGYNPASTYWKSMLNTIYDYGVEEYRKKNYDAAEKMFNLIAGHSRSADYLTLCKAHDGEASVDELWKLANVSFEDARSLLTTGDYMCEFMIGHWTGSGYYFTMEYYQGYEYQYYATYTLPWQYSGNFEFVNGHYRVFHNGGTTSLNEFRFTIESWNAVKVYCYKNGYTYTLYRQ